MDAEVSLAGGIQTAMLESTLELLFPQHATITAVVEKEQDGSKEIGQVHLYEEAAYLIYIHPGDLACVADACALLDGLVRLAGERGAHFLLAAIQENNSIHYGLRQSGFRLAYTHKIWQVNPDQRFPRDDNYQWQPVVEKDYLSLSSIYQHCVPPALQPILPLKEKQLPQFMLSVKNEVRGYAYLHRYAQAAFLYPYVCPLLSDTQPALSSLINTLPVHTKVFIVIPSFQGGLESARNSLSAKTVMKQQVLVKYTALRLKSAQSVRSRLEVRGQHTESSTPMAPSSRRE